MSRPLLTIALFASVLLSVLLQSADGAGADFGDHILQRDAATDQIPGLWLSDLFYKALANFTLRWADGPSCRRQSALYEEHLSNHTSWAVRMLESWDRYPVGILAGNTYQMGVYDECVDISYPLKGQYCLSEIKLIPPVGRDYSFKRTEDLDDFGNNHAWKTILGWADYKDQVQRNVFNLGICIPDECSALDLQTSLQSKFDEAFSPAQFKAVVRVDPIKCRVREDMYPYDTAYYVTWWIFSLIVLICCGATLHHFIRILYQQNTNENGEVPSSFLYEFSLIESMRTLLKFDKDSKLNFFYILKVITMLPIIFGHKLYGLVSNPISNPKYMEDIYLNGPAMFLTGLNAVDPFFFVSGFIMYKGLSREFQKSKAESVWKTLSKPIIQRIIRLLPAYCVMMAITAHFVPHHGDGPLWPYKSWEEAEICKNYWWTNLLFISNFVDVKYQCLIMSWYLSCDIQFFVIGVIVVYVYTKNPKYGVALLGTIIGLSISVPFIITLLTGREGMDMSLIPHIMYPRNILSLNESYRPSYMRATPFFGGLAVSFVLEKLKEKKVKFSQTVVQGGILSICTFTLWVQFYGTVFYERNRPYYPLEHALYSTICHCTWAVAGTWIIISYFTSGYGLLENLISNKFIMIMGKLSYPVLLVNITIMQTSQSSQRLPVHLSSRYVIEAYLYDAFMCYLMAIILYLVVDEPFAKLTKKLFYQRKSRDSLIKNGTPIKTPATCSSKTVKND
ncbi:unnamed protein product [Macrosiphum euphorbiae]|uniref:Nose resistant-to-fluoxetine protein N-terminal domain-containing protein n=1 Tax=Macrosiphum euphorbiae TaxID=13131 RepID=A0AAV0X9W4_9HEMI|nr:unnamed protein product [Macrosiphum euphorbiae]